MSFFKNKVFVLGFSALILLAFKVNAFAGNSWEDVLKVGKPLPDALLSRHGKPDIRLNNLKGKIKIISVVPQLNTPTCDEQTHRFSETNGGLDKHLDILTISTNSAKGQSQFARKAKIKNLIFLSDAPNYDFGKKNGITKGEF